MNLSRRKFMGWLGVAAASVGLPWGRAKAELPPGHAATGEFEVLSHTAGEVAIPGVPMLEVTTQNEGIWDNDALKAIRERAAQALREDAGLGWPPDLLLHNAHRRRHVMRTDLAQLHKDRNSGFIEDPSRPMGTVDYRATAAVTPGADLRAGKGESELVDGLLAICPEDADRRAALAMVAGVVDPVTFRRFAGCQGSPTWRRMGVYSVDRGPHVVNYARGKVPSTCDCSHCTQKVERSQGRRQQASASLEGLGLNLDDFRVMTKG